MTIHQASPRSLLTALAVALAAFWILALSPAVAVGQDAPAKTKAQKEEGAPFKLPPLPYAYDALEPTIDEQTMRLHHDKHHAGYVKNLNAAVKGRPQLADKSIEQLLRNLEEIPEEVRDDIRNQGGGHFNHTMFWEIMTPGGSKKPTGELAEAIEASFGSFKEFQQKFEQAGSKVFGSGWVWLVRNKDGKLKIVTTPNQNNPISEGMYPVMGNDVWEHAYYLKYQNRRGEYLSSWWNVVNWDKVAERYKEAAKS